MKLRILRLDTGTNLYHQLRMSAAALQLKRSLAAAIRRKMADDNLSVTTFAKRTRTARNSVRRILDAKNTSITLNTMARAAEALNLELILSVKRLSPEQLGKVADRYAVATNKKEVARLETELLEGFYGRPIKQGHAKDTAV
jgi:transcriptional regulator with XRE-family HTH domain